MIYFRETLIRSVLSSPLQLCNQLSSGMGAASSPCRTVRTNRKRASDNIYKTITNVSAFLPLTLHDYFPYETHRFYSKSLFSKGLPIQLITKLTVLAAGLLPHGIQPIRGSVWIQLQGYYCSTRRIIFQRSLPDAGGV